MNGDELNLVLKKISEDQNFDEHISYIEQNKPGSILAVLNPIFLNNENNIEKKLLYLKNIKNNENSPHVLRDLALFYQFYLGNSNYDKKFQILNELSGPDKPFRLLAVEGKIDLYLEKGLFKEALQEIDMVKPELSNSLSLNNRLKNLEIIIETLIK